MGNDFLSNDALPFSRLLKPDPNGPTILWLTPSGRKKLSMVPYPYYYKVRPGLDIPNALSRS